MAVTIKVPNFIDESPVKRMRTRGVVKRKVPSLIDESPFKITMGVK